MRLWSTTVVEIRVSWGATTSRPGAELSRCSHAAPIDGTLWPMPRRGWYRRRVGSAPIQSVGAVLVPVSSSAFSPDGVGALMVFERDSAGRVVGYVQGLASGQVIRAVRLH